MRQVTMSATFLTADSGAELERTFHLEDIAARRECRRELSWVRGEDNSARDHHSRREVRAALGHHRQQGRLYAAIDNALL